MNQLSEDEILKILNFLRKNPHFFDESNPLFYNPIEKNAQKKQLGESFEPPIEVFLVSARIRYIINKVIDDFFLIQKGKRPKWKYFDKAKFMLPALMTKRNAIPKNNDSENSSDDDIDDNKLFKKNNNGNEHFMESRENIKMEIKEDIIGTYCKICNFLCSTDQFSSHFELYHHRKGEESWKTRNKVEQIECPCCKKSCKYWYIFFQHIEAQHLIKKEEINHKVFTINNKRLSINLGPTVSQENILKNQLFYNRKLP